MNRRVDSIFRESAVAGGYPSLIVEGRATGCCSTFVVNVSVLFFSFGVGGGGRSRQGGGKKDEIKILPPHGNGSFWEK